MPGQAGRLITPEAVALEVNRAGPGTRIAARGLDVAIQSAMLIALLIVVGIAGQASSGGTALLIISLVGGFLVVFGYPAILETLWHGRTVGKAAFGLRVVTKQGAPITFRHAAIRSGLWVVDGLLLGPVIGVICLLATRDTVRVGDLAAGTIVLRERSGAPVPTAVGFGVPPGFEHYVATLDVSGVGTDEYALVRAFLLRTSTLLPDARARLGLDIAGRVAGRLRLGPQPMTPEVFLSCVAAAVQRRSGSVHQSYGWGRPPSVWGQPPSGSGPPPPGDSWPPRSDNWPPPSAPAPAPWPAPAHPDGGWAPPGGDWAPPGGEWAPPT